MQKYQYLENGKRYQNSDRIFIDFVDRFWGSITFKQLSKILKDWDIWNAHTGRAARLEAAYPTIKNTEKVTGKVIDFKGWTPTVIKGGKDKLATGGIAAHFRRR